MGGRRREREREEVRGVKNGEERGREEREGREGREGVRCLGSSSETPINPMYQDTHRICMIPNWPPTEVKTAKIKASKAQPINTTSKILAPASKAN